MNVLRSTAIPLVIMSMFRLLSCDPVEPIGDNYNNNVPDTSSYTTCSIESQESINDIEIIESCKASKKSITIESSNVITNLSITDVRFNPEVAQFTSLDNNFYKLEKERDFSGNYNLEVTFSDNSSISISIKVNKSFGNLYYKCSVISNILLPYGNPTEDTITPTIESCHFKDEGNEVTISRNDVIYGVLFYDDVHQSGVNKNENPKEAKFNLDNDFVGSYEFMVDYGNHRTTVVIFIERK